MTVFVLCLICLIIGWWAGSLYAAHRIKILRTELEKLVKQNVDRVNQIKRLERMVKLYMKGAQDSEGNQS